MTIGSILLGAALFFLVVLFLARPFLENREETAQQRRKRRARRARLQEAKEAILAEIRQLDFDHDTGKLPDEQHKVERAQLMAAAAEVLQELDALSQTGPPPAAPAPEKTADLDDDIEAAIARRRKRRATRQAAPAQNGAARFCPQCGRRVDAEDRFCATCGYNLSERMTANTAS